MSEVTFVKEPLAGCQFIDVREPAEFSSEKIEGSKLLPLSQLPQMADSLDKNEPLVIVCQTGNRARRAASELATRGFANVSVLEGGIQAWKASGKPALKQLGGVWAMDRQVRFAAGLFVLLGLFGAFYVHPYFIGLSVFVAAGLIFSAVTNTCGMAVVLGKMPWNSRS